MLAKKAPRRTLLITRRLALRNRTRRLMTKKMTVPAKSLRLKKKKRVKKL